MRIPLQIKTKSGKVEGQLPTSWDDVTLRQYFEIMEWKKDPDPIKLYSILTGIPYDVMYNSQQMSVTTNIDPHIEFLKEENHIPKLPPEKVRFFSKEVEVPTDFMRQELGIMLGIKTEVKKIYDSDLTEAEKESKVSATAISFLMYKTFTGKELEKGFDKEVMRFVPAIEDMPVTTALPLALFFWKVTARRKKIGTKLYLMKMKARRVLTSMRNWLGRATFGYYGSFQAAGRLTLMGYSVGYLFQQLWLH